MPSINEGKSDMGARMKLTTAMAIVFSHHVIAQRRSPCDARIHVKEALPGRDVPRPRTFHDHIGSGDTGVRHGDTSHHPGRRRRSRAPAHPAMTVPGGRQLKNRTAAANERRKPGHFEMDAIVPGYGAKGGPLAPIGGMSRQEL